MIELGDQLLRQFSLYHVRDPLILSTRLSPQVPSDRPTGVGVMVERQKPRSGRLGASKCSPMWQHLMMMFDYDHRERLQMS
jgi:hypothetical protein